MMEKMLIAPSLFSISLCYRALNTKIPEGASSGMQKTAASAKIMRISEGNKNHNKMRDLLRD